MPYAPSNARGLEDAARELADGAMVRRLDKIARTLSALAADTGVAPRDLAKRALDDVTAAIRRTSRSSSVTLADTLDECWAAFDTQTDPTMAVHGLRALDEWTVGMRAAQLIIDAGRPGSGKTSLATCAAKATARLGRTVLFWSLEMERGELGRRLKCSEAKVEVLRYLRRNLTRDETQRLYDATQRLGTLGQHLRIIDAGSTIEDIAAGSRREHARTPLSLVVIDHLHHIQPQRGERDEQTTIANAAKGAKDLAKDLAVPVLLLTQLNRGVEGRENKRPTLQDLRASGTIEQVADVVIGLYRDEYYNPDSRDRGIAEAIILKQRDGATGTVRVGFRREFAEFHDLESSPPSSEYDADASEWGAP